MLNSSIIEIDVHGLTAAAAVAKIESVIGGAGSNVYRIRVIHGYNRGTSIRQAVYREIGHGLNPKVLRIVPGDNQGVTEIVLREYY